MTPAPPGHADEEPASSGRGSALVAAGILLSRIAGLVRERTVAHYLGAGAALEAFRAALRIPNLMQNLLGEGVLSASFIPVYARLLEQGREEDAGRLAGAIAGLLTLVSGVLVVLGVVFARPLTAVLALGFSGEKLDLAVTFVRILTPGVGFLVLSAWCLGVLNSHRRFFLSYVAPVVWNAAMIAVLVAAGLRGLAAEGLAVALAWGALVGGFLQFAVQLPGVLRISRGLRPSVRIAVPGVRSVIRAFGPVLAGRGVVQLAAYADLLLASFLATGGLNSLQYAQVLYLLPISLFGMSVAAAELPELSRATPDNPSGLHRRVQTGLRRIAFFVLPTAAAYLLLGDVVVGALYQGGAFTGPTTRQVWAVLAAYSLGLVATASSRILQSALYGLQDPRTPALVSAARVALSAAIGVVLMLQLDRVVIDAGALALLDPLPVTGPVSEALREARDNQLRLGGVGLALGASAGAWLEYLLLRRAVAHRLGAIRMGGGSLARTAGAAGAAAVAGLLARQLTDGLPPLAAAVPVLGAAGLAYLAAAAALHLEGVTAVGRAAGRFGGRFGGRKRG
jgi:putative peptidoglycan lipid II flippase